MRLDIDGLSLAFGDKKVLRDIKLSVADGEFFGLMGPNGSGKTTLLRCIMNYLRPEGDCIKVDGKSLQSLSSMELARTFAVVPQSSATDFTFTSYDIVMMGRMPHIESRFSGATKDDAAAVKKAMERTDTWKFASRPFFGLSGGERQRVIVARAIAQQPKALLLDEPTVFLDINGQFEVMDLIKRLNREESIGVIAVLHDVNLASRYCDKIALLNQGRVEAFGPPKEVLTPEVIQSVFGVDVVVRKDPFTNAVYVMPHAMTVVAHRHGTRAHVLCGGGTGGPVMKALLDQGFSVTAGVVNILDSDFQNAEDLHITAVAEGPFAPIGEDAHNDNLKLISDSSVIVVSPFPVGPGNVKNLEAARSALDLGKKVYIIRPEQGKQVDFVGGKASALITELIRLGAIQVDGTDDLVARLSHGGSG